FRYRYYSPTLGRFVQTDPIGVEGGLNLYGFVSNGPVSKNDPMGLAAGLGATIVLASFAAFALLLVYCSTQTGNDCVRQCGSGKVKKAERNIIGVKIKKENGEVEIQGIPCGWNCECKEDEPNPTCAAN
ncbi:MAG TPA: RHS repeat-associated core domain-containing protein, partial [Verrucomicrobiota bacterium]|nr:RHS repeat-associated core domain-containing protein [Verrucomicrobiota bacterium]